MLCRCMGAPQLQSLHLTRAGAVATLTTPSISIVSGGLMTIAGIGLLARFAPGFWRYDARDPAP